MIIQTTSSIIKHAAVDTLCTVCGYDMDYPPEDYNICPSCGTEFGLNDVNSTVPDLREAWIETGPVWWSRTDHQPIGWDAEKQLNLLRKPEELARSDGPFGSIVWNDNGYSVPAKKTLSSATNHLIGGTSGRRNYAVIKPDLVRGRVA